MEFQMELLLSVLLDPITITGIIIIISLLILPGYYYNKQFEVEDKGNGYIIKKCKKTGTVYWYKDEKLHREDGPAIETPDGVKIWYLNGKRHREDGPSGVLPNGCEYWYKDGLPHREDGPAINIPAEANEFDEEGKYWYKDGLLHREDGPAIERVDGSKEWYLNGKRHREDGPAIELPIGTNQWFINGKELTDVERILIKSISKK